MADLGGILCEEKDHESARAAYREALEIFAALGHRRGIARALEGFGCMAVAQGEASRTLKLCGAASHLRRMIGAPLPRAEQSKLDQMLVPAWSSLTASRGQSEWEAGYSMTLEKAIQYSLEDSAPAI